MGEPTGWSAVLVGLLVAAGAVAHRRRSSWRRATRRRLPPAAGSSRTVHRSAGGRRFAQRSARRRAPDPVATLPEVVDLLAVAAATGLPAASALLAVAPRVPEPWRAAVATCVDQAAHGALLTDALGHLVDAVGDPARPVVAVLRAGIADGDPLAGDLARLAGDARDLRRRRAEEQARRIPVRLLLPLVTCSLPAFAVLSIVPIVAGALEGLRFPSVPS